MGYYASHDAQLTVLPGHYDALREVVLSTLSGLWQPPGAPPFDTRPLGDLFWRCLSEDGSSWATPELPDGELSTVGYGRAYSYSADDPLMVAIAPHVIGAIDWTDVNSGDDRWRLRFRGDGTVTHHMGVVSVAYPSDPLDAE